MANNGGDEHQQRPAEPDADLKQLDRLVDTGQVSGDAEGRVTYEWMEGGFFMQHVEILSGGAHA